MNYRTRGLVIALSSAAAGALLPAAVTEHLAGNIFMAAGLAVIVVLNATIALIHIKEPAELDRWREDEKKAETKRMGAQAIRSVNSTDTVKREAGTS